MFSFEAITILPANPINGLGFKRANYTNCTKTNGEKLIQCVEENTFTGKETFIGQLKHFDVQLFYVNDEFHGLGQSVKIKYGVIKKSLARTIFLKMNPNITYEIAITDPKLQFSSYTPDSIPTSLITLKKNAGFAVLFLKEIYVLKIM